MRPLTRTGALAICLSVTAAEHGAVALAQVASPAAPTNQAAPANPALPIAATPFPWQSWAKSAEGRSIEILRVGAGSHQVLVIAGLAGDDPLAVELGERLITHLTEFPSLVAATTVTFVRDANPDGRARRTAANAHGILLDYNFSSTNWRKLPELNTFPSGRLPESEPETRALTELTAQLRPERVIVLATSTSPTIIYAGPRADWAAKLAFETKLPLVAPDLAQASGSLVVYLGQDRAIPCANAALPRSKDIATLWPRVRAGLSSAVSHGFNASAPPIAAAAPPLQAGTLQAAPSATPNAPPAGVPVLTVLADSTTVVKAPAVSPTGTTAQVVSTPPAAVATSSEQPRRPFSFLLRDVRETSSPDPVSPSAPNETAPRVLSADELATGGKLVPVTLPPAADAGTPFGSGSPASDGQMPTTGVRPFGRRPNRVEIRGKTPLPSKSAPVAAPETSKPRTDTKPPPAVPVIDEKALPQPAIPRAPEIRP